MMEVLPLLPRELSLGLALGSALSVRGHLRMQSLEPLRVVSCVCGPSVVSTRLVNGTALPRPDLGVFLLTGGMMRPVDWGFDR